MGHPMFKEFRIQNFRTHVDTTIRLGDTTLIVGPNASGKTNLFRALLAFSYIARQARPHLTGPRVLESRILRDRCRFSDEDAPICFSCVWEKDDCTLSYSIEMRRGGSNQVLCRENLTIHGSASGKQHQWSAESAGPELATEVANSGSVEYDDKELVRKLFRDLGSIHYYHFEPTNLRQAKARIPQSDESTSTEADGTRRLTEGYFSVPGQLGQRGEGLSTVLRHILDNEPRMLQRFRVLMESFDSTFRDYKFSDRSTGETSPLFSFRLSSEARMDDFQAALLPDGFLRACAISVLCALDRPPSLILIEEVENGLDVVRLELIIEWLQHAMQIADGSRRRGNQFVLTSHSPIVLRSFADKLESVYQIRFDHSLLRSIALNLALYLRVQIEAGVVKGVMRDEKVFVNPDTLVKLWLTRRIGGDAIVEE